MSQAFNYSKKQQFSIDNYFDQYPVRKWLTWFFIVNFSKTVLEFTDHKT